MDSLPARVQDGGANRCPFRNTTDRQAMKSLTRLFMSGLNPKWFGLLAVSLALTTAGCGSQEVPVEELTFEELNFILARIDQSGEEFPNTVQELMNYPSLRGKIPPTLPPGFYLAVDRETKSVVVLLDEGSVQ